MPRQVVDIVLFNNELELLDLRIKILEDVVDFFIIKEATHTFQGDLKEMLSKTYDHPKVFTYVVEFPLNMSTWERDRFQRGTQIDLTAYGINEDAIVMTSDLDEIPDPEAVKWIRDNFNPSAMYALEQKMHQYFLNVRNLSEPWAGTRVCSMEKYRLMDAETMRHSQHLCMTLPDAGWHWSFLGGEKQIEKKIRSYAHEEYDNEDTIQKIKERILNNEDIFNRGFQLQTVELDDSYPQYVLDNKEKLAHLIRPL